MATQRIFECTYAINGPKKIKTYKDGTIRCRNKEVTLYSLEDSMLDKAIVNTSPFLMEDDELLIGRYLVVVGLVHANLANNTNSTTTTSIPHTTHHNIPNQSKPGLSNNNLLSNNNTQNNNLLSVPNKNPGGYQPYNNTRNIPHNPPNNTQINPSNAQNGPFNAYGASTNQYGTKPTQYINNTNQYTDVNHSTSSFNTNTNTNNHYQQQTQTSSNSWLHNQNTNRQKHGVNDVKTNIQPQQTFNVSVPSNDLQVNQTNPTKPSIYNKSNTLHSTYITNTQNTSTTTTTTTTTTNNNKNTTNKPSFTLTSQNNSTQHVFQLWENPRIYVSERISRHLRPHQKEGVKFIFECLIGRKIARKHGVILMDDVGLGKTLQTIAIFDSMLSHPWVKSNKAIVCCPNILVNMWHRELIKWLPFRFVYTAVDANKTNSSHIESFRSNNRPHILIISYEQCRKYGDIIKTCSNCLLVCDEAHRLKSTADDNKTINILKSIPTKLRLLLTATPIQNNLAEFYAMANFANPEYLSPTLASFTSTYITPILAMQDVRNQNKPSVQQLGTQMNDQLMTMINNFCLRRTHDTIGNFLPPKTDFLTFLRPTNVQINVIKTLIQLHQNNPQEYQVLPVLNLLRKVATSPYLLTFTPPPLDTTNSKKNKGITSRGLDDDDDISPSNDLSTSQSLIAKVKHLIPPVPPLQQLTSSTKMMTLYKLIENYIPYTNIIIISSYTETLRFIETSLTALNPTLFQSLNLDGSCDAKSKAATVTKFNTVVTPVEDAMSKQTNSTFKTQTSNSGYGNKKLTKAQQLKLDKQEQSGDPTKHSVLFLSAKAAGAGLNLTNGCVQIIVDSNWNPAIDIQAAGRMWRMGNTQHVMSFQLITNGSLDEHILLRQIAKNDVASSLLGTRDNSNTNNANNNSNNNSFNNSNGTISNTPTSNNNLNKLTQEELRKVLSFQYENHVVYNMLKPSTHINSSPNSSPERTGMPEKRRINQLNNNNQDNDEDEDEIIVKIKKKPKYNLYESESDSGDSNGGNETENEEDDEYSDVFNTDDDSDTIEEKRQFIVAKKAIQGKNKSSSFTPNGSNDVENQLPNGEPCDQSVTISPYDTNTVALAKGDKNKVDNTKTPTCDGNDHKNIDQYQIQSLNGNYLYYPSQQFDQLTELTFPIILTTRSKRDVPTEDSVQMKQFIDSSNTSIFNQQRLSYVLVKQTKFDDDEVEEEKEQDNVNERALVGASTTTSNTPSTSTTSNQHIQTRAQSTGQQPDHSSHKNIQSTNVIDNSVVPIIPILKSSPLDELKKFTILPDVINNNIKPAKPVVKNMFESDSD